MIKNINYVSGGVGKCLCFSNKHKDPLVETQNIDECRITCCKAYRGRSYIYKDNDTLDHASPQVGVCRVEIVRNGGFKFLDSE
jgi:hypothetical protein